jgi:hypothetical protein
MYALVQISSHDQGGLCWIYANRCEDKNAGEVDKNSSRVSRVCKYRSGPAKSSNFET